MKALAGACCFDLSAFLYFSSSFSSNISCLVTFDSSVTVSEFLSSVMTFVVGMLVDHESNGGLTNNVLVPRAFEWSHKCVPTTIP